MPFGLPALQRLVPLWSLVFFFAVWAASRLPVFMHGRSVDILMWSASPPDLQHAVIYHALRGPCAAKACSAAVFAAYKGKGQPWAPYEGKGSHAVLEVILT